MWLAAASRSCGAVGGLRVDRSYRDISASQGSCSWFSARPQCLHRLRTTSPFRSQMIAGLSVSSFVYNSCSIAFLSVAVNALLRNCATQCKVFLHHFHRRLQGVLHRHLVLQTREHGRLFDRVLGHDPVAVDRPVVTRLELPGRAHALYYLLVLFHVPPLAEVDEDAPAVLQVGPVAGARRVRDHHAVLAPV